MNTIKVSELKQGHTFQFFNRKNAKNLTVQAPPFMVTKEEFPNIPKLYLGRRIINCIDSRGKCCQYKLLPDTTLFLKT